MDTQWWRAVGIALALHGALAGSVAWFGHQLLRQPAADPLPVTEIEIATLPVIPTRARDAQNHSSPTPTPPASARHSLGRAGATRVAGLTPELAIPGKGEQAGAGPAPVPQGSPAPRRRIDLGLDGLLLGRELGSAPRKAARPRAIAAIDSWSESVLRSALQASPIDEGSALLTIEWDENGRLLRVQSSAHSSASPQWDRLVDMLRARLARRPLHPQARGQRLRIVYLVSSELVRPGNPHSKLPDSKRVALQQLREENLPPATVVGVELGADRSGTAEHGLTITLSRSETY